MKPADPALVAFLAANRQFAYIDTFTFYLVGGTDENYRLRYCTGQQDQAFYPLDGDPIHRIYKAGEVLVSGLRAKQSIGPNVDEQKMVLTPAPGALIQGVEFTRAVIEGALDGAFVRRDRYYFAALGQPTVGGAPKFYGLVTTFDDVGRTDAQLSVKSGLVILNQPMPHHLFRPGCLNRVFDAGCGLSMAAFAVTDVVSASPAETTLFVPWSAADSSYIRGRIFFENMGLVGTWRAIKYADTTGLTLGYPLPQVPVIGEQFVAYPGCDQTKAGGCTRLVNTSRYRGFDFTPQSDTAF